MNEWICQLSWPIGKEKGNHTHITKHRPTINILPASRSSCSISAVQAPSRIRVYVWLHGVLVLVHKMVLLLMFMVMVIGHHICKINCLHPTVLAGHQFSSLPSLCSSFLPGCHSCIPAHCGPQFTPLRHKAQGWRDTWATNVWRARWQGQDVHITTIETTRNAIDMLTSNDTRWLNSTIDLGAAKGAGIGKCGITIFVSCFTLSWYALDTNSPKMTHPSAG
jgi:hypothetical protein